MKGRPNAQPRLKIRESITRQIIEALESGALPPWRQPWSNDPAAGPACNVVSRKKYRGINPLLLACASARHNLYMEPGRYEYDEVVMVHVTGDVPPQEVRYYVQPNLFHPSDRHAGTLSGRNQGRRGPALRMLKEAICDALSAGKDDVSRD